MLEWYATLRKLSVHSGSLNNPANIGASIIILKGSNNFLSLRYLNESKSISLDLSEDGVFLGLYSPISGLPIS